MARPKHRLRAIAYVYAPAELAIADPLAFLGHSARAQEEAVRLWAAAHDADVVEVLRDDGAPGVSGIAARMSFGAALEHVRAGVADVICVASLTDMCEDVIVQELFLAEARVAGVRMASAHAPDDDLLTEVTTDRGRALIREVLAIAPEFQGQMRSLRARLRRDRTLAELESAHATLVRMEAMEERGASPGDILAMVAAARRAPRPHRILGRLRGRTG